MGKKVESGSGGCMMINPPRYKKGFIWNYVYAQVGRGERKKVKIRSLVEKLIWRKNGAF